MALSSDSGWVQVFLAMPSNCTTNPDGTKRKVTGDHKNVMLYSSGDEGYSFVQVAIL